MDLDVDGGTILYSVGAFFGAVAALYFGRTVLFDLSTATKAFILFIGFVGFVVAGTTVQKSLLDTVFYVLATASYLSFFIYTSLTFDLSTDQIFFFLAVSSVLFSVLGYVIREEKIDLDGRDAKRGLAIIALVVFALLAVDVAGPQERYDVDIANELVVDDSRPVIGNVTVTNEFFLPRQIDPPRYEVCLYRNGTRERSHVSYDSLPGSIAGGETLNLALIARVPLEADRSTGETLDIGPLPVQQRETCPETLEEDGIVVTETDERRYAD